MFKYLIFLLILITSFSCSHIPQRREIASTSDCSYTLKEILFSRTPQLQSKLYLDKVRINLEGLEQLRGDEFFAKLTEIEESLNELKFYAIRYGDSDEAQKILEYFMKLNEFRLNAQFKKGEFSFRRLKSFITSINKKKKLEGQNHKIRSLNREENRPS